MIGIKALSVFCVGPVGSAPVANFTGNNLTPTSVNTVTFTDSSTNTPTSWVWSYNINGGGYTQFSTSQNPSLVLSTVTPGLIGGEVMSIRLAATNAFGNNTLTRTNYLSIQEL